jgi:hypothetical protein
MSSRIQQLLKLASQIMSKTDMSELNHLLAFVSGYSDIDEKIDGMGYRRGPAFAKNKFYLMKDNEKITNAYLVGDYRGMRISANSPMVAPKKKKIPWDAQNTPAAIYDRLEREKELNEP